MFETAHRVAAGLALALALPATAGATTDPAFGYWLVENRRAIIEIHSCGPMACGRIVWLAEPFDANGEPKTDINNPDPAMRHRMLCGLPLIEGLEAEGPGAWEDGEIYNSRDGAKYNVRVSRHADDRLEVRGFLGISLLGKSQYWTRVGGDRGGCSRIDRPGRDR